MFRAIGYVLQKFAKGTLSLVGGLSAGQIAAAYGVSASTATLIATLVATLAVVVGPRNRTPAEVSLKYHEDTESA